MSKTTDTSDGTMFELRTLAYEEGWTGVGSMVEWYKKKLRELKRHQEEKASIKCTPD